MRRLRFLINRHRAPSTNRALGLLLAFNAGAVNAGGFLVLHMYTTHMTGNVTDLGMELGKAILAHRTAGNALLRIEPNWPRMRICAGLVGMFVLGGLAGAWGFKYVGFVFVVPLAALLLAVSVPPFLRDIPRSRILLARLGK